MAHIKRMTDKRRTLPYRAQVKRRGHSTLVKMFQTRAQAERWAREQEKSILEAGLPLTIKHLEKHTVGDIVRRYLEEITPKKGSHVSESAVLNAFLRRDICKKSLAYVKKQDAHAYIDERLKETWRGNPITPRTVRREVNSIQHVFEVAKERWGFENLTNPFRGIAIKGSVYRRKRRLREGELEKLSDAIRKCRGLNRYYVDLAMGLATQTGMRLQEIFNLTWQDVDIEKRRIEIRKSKTDHKSEYAGRTIVVPVVALTHLMSLQIQLLKGLNPERVGTFKFDFKGRIFPMGKEAFKQSWADVLKRAGINDLTFQDLRREAGSKFDEVGLTKGEHDLMMGHSSRDMASLYIHADLKSIQDKLDRDIFKGSTLDEMYEKIEKEGVQPETLIVLRVFTSAVNEGVSREERARRVKKAIRNWEAAGRPEIQPLIR